MFIAFGLLMPSANIIARYFKVTKNQDFPRVLDNKFWWHSHLILQNLAAILMSIALVIHTQWSFQSDHAKLGLLTLCLVYLQIISGLLRGSKGSAQEWGDHYSMSKRRIIFEFYHKKMGWLIMLFGFFTLYLGFDMVDYSIGKYTLFLVFLIYAGVILNSINKKRYKDTWVAIWGEGEKK